MTSVVRAADTISAGQPVQHRRQQRPPPVPRTWRARPLHLVAASVSGSALLGAVCTVTMTAEVTGPAGPLVQAVVSPLSAFGQRRRLTRLAALAEFLDRRAIVCAA